MLNINLLMALKRGYICIYPFDKRILHKWYHKVPFLELYEKTTGMPVTEYSLDKFKKKHSTLLDLSYDRLQCTLQILSKFNITAVEACRDPHVFCMNPISMDNYGEILQECGFVNVTPKHIIRYHTLVRSRTISYLKKEGLIRNDLKLEEILQNYFHEWPSHLKRLENFPDENTTILTVRMNVLEKYLKWRLAVTSEEFQKYCRNYLPLKHKPMSDIQESLNIAKHEIKFDTEVIRRNGFIVSADPINSKLILKNVESLAGIDIREAIKIEPAILKNNYNSLLEIKNLLMEYRISDEAQRRCLRVYCMCPKTVKKRLDELMYLKEYQVLATNPRVLSMVVHKSKMVARLEMIQAAKKQCYSLNHLVSSTKVFNNYINNFGSKVCGRDIATLIMTSLKINKENYSQGEIMKLITGKLRRHKYWLHSALDVIGDNIHFLKEKFDDDVIFNNCHLLLYPVHEVQHYTELLLHVRDGNKEDNKYNIQLDTSYNTLRSGAVTDKQILSLVLYEIEKKYHFSGDGIWNKPDMVKAEAHVC